MQRSRTSKSPVSSVIKVNPNLPSPPRKPPYGSIRGLLYPLLLLGDLHSATGDHITALRYYREATTVNPALAEAYHRAGISLMKLGRNAEALSTFRLALGKNPKWVETHVGLGDVYAAMEQLPQAAMEYHIALQLDPQLDLAPEKRAIAQQK